MPCLNICYILFLSAVLRLTAVKYPESCSHQIPEIWEIVISDVQEYHVDTFVMGDDWKGKFDFLKDYCEVVYLPRTEGISTTKNKKDLGLGTTITKEDE